MTSILLKLNAGELNLLIALASDQLFHREFIDPRRPDYRSDPEALQAAKRLLERLRMTADRANGTRTLKRVGIAL